MHLVKKGNPEFVLGEDPAKIKRDNLAKVESHAVRDGDRGDRSSHDPSSERNLCSEFR
jgi:hypothetical protein